MTRFADHILAEGFADGVIGGYPDDKTAERAHQWGDQAAERAVEALHAGIPVFDVGAVAAAVADGLTLPVSPPAMRPPYDTVWAEYALPSNWAGARRADTGRLRVERVGGLFRVAGWEDRWALHRPLMTETVDQVMAELADLRARFDAEDRAIEAATGKQRKQSALDLMNRASDQAPDGMIDGRMVQGAADAAARRKLLDAGWQPRDDGRVFAAGAPFTDVPGVGPLNRPKGVDQFLGWIDDSLGRANGELAALQERRAALLGETAGFTTPVQLRDRREALASVADSLVETVKHHERRRDLYRQRIRDCERLLARLEAVDPAEANESLAQANRENPTHLNLQQLEGTLHGEPRWVVLLDGYCRVGGENVAGMGQWGWALDEHGDPCSDTAYLVPPDPSHTADVDRAGVDRHSQMALVLTLAMSLVNVHNVDVVEHVASEKVQRARRRRDRLPLVTYRTLAIRPMTGRGGRAGERVTSDEGVRWHIRRGHFRDYRDKGLFGRPELRRIFWFSATAAGNPERGQVVKDYEVEAP